MLRLDDPIDRKRPARLRLAIGAVTGMDKHRLGRERKLHGTAETGGKEESVNSGSKLLKANPE